MTTDIQSYVQEKVRLQSCLCLCFGFVLDPLLKLKSQFILSLIANCLPCFFLFFLLSFLLSPFFPTLYYAHGFVFLKTCMFHTHEMYQKAHFISPRNFAARQDIAGLIASSGLPIGKNLSWTQQGGQARRSSQSIQARSPSC